MPTSQAAAITEQLDRIRAWLTEHAPEAARGAGPVATRAQLAQVEEALGVKLPAEVKTFFTYKGGFSIFEYSLPAGENLGEMLTFKATSKRSFAAQRWLPLAEDGGGNLWLVDLSGEAPLVRRWERAGRVVSEEGAPLVDFVRRLADALATGEHRYERQSGTFDGPWVDLLADAAG